MLQVNGGSPAEQAGLRAGDAVIRVNNTDMFSLRHKDAQDVIVRSGNSFEMTVQRLVFCKFTGGIFLMFYLDIRKIFVCHFNRLIYR